MTIAKGHGRVPSQAAHQLDCSPGAAGPVTGRSPGFDFSPQEWEPIQRWWWASHARLAVITGFVGAGPPLLPCVGMRLVGAFAHQGQRTAARGRFRWQSWQFLDL